MCPGCRWVHSGSLVSVVHALVVGGLFRGRWVHSGVPSRSFCLFGVIGFTPVHPGDRYIHFCVRSGASWVYLVSFRVVAFTRLLPGYHWNDSVMLRSLGCAQLVAGFIQKSLL